MNSAAHTYSFIHREVYTKINVFAKIFAPTHYAIVTQPISHFGQQTYIFLVYILYKMLANTKQTPNQIYTH